MSILANTDAFEVAILVLFFGAVIMASYSVWDAWKNELAALDAADPNVSLLGLEDLIRTTTTLLLMAIPGSILSILLMTTSSAVQETTSSPQELSVAITLRVVLILFSLGLFAVSSLSAWLRHRMSQRREAALAVYEAGGTLNERLERALAENTKLTKEALKASTDAGTASGRAEQAADHINQAIERLGLGLKDVKTDVKEVSADAQAVEVEQVEQNARLDAEEGPRAEGAPAPVERSRERRDRERLAVPPSKTA